MKMNLQYFAEEPLVDNPDVNPEDKQENPPAEPDKKYTDDDVNKIIDAKFAKWKEDQKKEQKEAERKAKMTAEQRIEDEKSELEKKIEEYERKEKVRDNIKVASTVLSDAHLPHDDELLELLASEDEEITKSAFDVIVNYIGKVKKFNTAQKTPDEGNQFSGSNADRKNLAERAKDKRIIK